MKELKVDNKWSVTYNPAENNRPCEWLRYGEPHSDFNENNAAISMFYALLDATDARSANHGPVRAKGGEHDDHTR